MLGRRPSLSATMLAELIVAARPRYRFTNGPTILSAGFRPFFLAAAIWAAIAIPLWLAMFAGAVELPRALAPSTWHVHEMNFGYAAATIAGFLLTAIPNWTGRMPLQGTPLGALVGLWALGRLAVLFSAYIGPIATAVLDLAFPAAFLAAVGHEIAAGRNWRNLPMVAALAALLGGNLLVHLEAMRVAATAGTGNRLGIAAVLMLISFIGGRIVPSFTRNWISKQPDHAGLPAAFDRVDRAALVITAIALLLFVIAPAAAVSGIAELGAGLALGFRFARWRGPAALREPLLWVLHLGYAWLACGLGLLGLDTLVHFWLETAVLHALTVGAIGTMTLAVMTRATLGHTGRPLTAGPVTTSIYALVTAAAVLRLVSPAAGAHYLAMLALAGAMWSAAFALFVVVYGRALTYPRVRDGTARPL
jgi:uncharacterized protein involved in response to NO